MYSAELTTNVFGKFPTTEESWQTEAPLSDAREVLRGWEPTIQRILDRTPEPLVDWKLVYRDPLPTWVSPGRRIALVGDAAHPFLPTSIQGASQSIEDGVALAVCLELAGKDRIPLAVRAYEKVRYGRVHQAQAMGVKTREKWHKANWDDIWKKPDMIHLTREPWLLNFDAEKDAYEKFGPAVHDLTKPRPKL